VNSAGKPGNGLCHHPSISAGGRFVAFESNATNLAPGTKKKRWNIFVRDLKKHKTKRVSVSSAGEQGNRDSRYASLSNHGGFIAFYSAAKNLVKRDTNHIPDVFPAISTAGRRYGSTSTRPVTRRTGPRCPSTRRPRSPPMGASSGLHQRQPTLSRATPTTTRTSHPRAPALRHLPFSRLCWHMVWPNVATSTWEGHVLVRDLDAAATTGSRRAFM
jgi:hypothetical protein